MLELTKMNGNGNDFLILDNRNFAYNSEQLRELTLNLCRRREAIGADGILVVEPSARLDFTMRLFNRDGSEGEMCGNGARCIARYVFEQGFAGNSMSFETLGGDQFATVDGHRVALKLAPVKVCDIQTEQECEIDGEKITYCYLLVGVPHTVIFEGKKRSDGEYFELGRKLRNRLDLFPLGANINFAVKRKDEDHSFDMVTYERGVEDLTLSCGTGSTATGIAAYVTGRSGEVSDIYNPGGINCIKLTCESDVVYPLLEGKTVRVAELRINDEML